MKQLILWGILIVPWLSLLFLKKEIVKRYMPVSIFTALLVTIYSEYGYLHQWWVIKERIFPVIAYVPFVYGSFLAGTLWIFHFTFGRFWVYLLTNIVVDFLFMFPANYWLESAGFYELVNRSNWNIFIDFVIMSVIIYGYQLWQEGGLKEGPEIRDKYTIDVDSKNWFRKREKAK
jgi:hypothetical protein